MDNSSDGSFMEPVQGRAILHALPAIILICGYLWLAIFLVAWAVSGLFLGGSLLATLVLLALLIPPGAFLSYHQIKLAIEAESKEK